MRRIVKLFEETVSENDVHCFTVEVTNFDTREGNEEDIQIKISLYPKPTPISLLESGADLEEIGNQLNQASHISICKDEWPGISESVTRLLEEIHKEDERKER